MHTNKLLGAIILIAGTSIGAGMLALPVATASFGLGPTTIMFLVCWAALVFTAFLILETNLWLKDDTNLISMAKHTLGKTGQLIAWIAYLLLLYSLMSAYLSGMDAILKRTIQVTLHFDLSQWAGSIILILLFGLIIYLGVRTIDYLNRIFFIGLVITYLLLITFVTPHIQPLQLMHGSFNKIWIALPIVITSFGFHIIIPSLRTYLKNDIKKLRLSIFIGSLIPLIVYLIWELLILGTVPTTGQGGLLSVYATGQPAVGLSLALQNILSNSWISVTFRYFAFFAIATSFIGVSLSLFDFLADGFQIKKNKLGRFSTAAITFIPPLVFALFYPRGFILALGYAGIFVAILLGILPASMAWSGRYKQQIVATYRVIGGKGPLILVTIFFASIIVVELAANRLH